MPNERNDIFYDHLPPCMLRTYDVKVIFHDSNWNRRTVVGSRLCTYKDSWPRRQQDCQSTALSEDVGSPPCTNADSGIREGIRLPL